MKINAFYVILKLEKYAPYKKTLIFIKYESFD